MCTYHTQKQSHEIKNAMEEHMSCTAAKSTEETKANRQNSK
jgi:hypothetical protein